MEGGDMGPSETSAVLEHWHIWSTPTYPRGQSWSARPVGARCAVVFADSREAIEKEISEYMTDLDQHVYEARQKLDNLPALYRGEREVLECLIAALASLAETMR
jgi:hypothetical protein